MSPGLAPIVRVSWRSFRVPFAAAAQTSRATLAAREGIIVTVETGDGRVGTGEASPLSDFEGGELGEVASAVEQMAAGILGRGATDCWDGPQLTATVSEASQRVARAGIETALADVLAQDQHLPMWKWLAQRSGLDLTEPVAIPANALIDGSSPEDVRASVRAAIQLGYRTVKLKVGVDSATDLHRVAAAREAGPDVELRLDANGAWDETTAIAVLNACAPHGISLCEQPLDPRRSDVIEATARLRKQATIPLALDESCRTLESLHHIIATRAAHAIVIKPMFTGLKDALEMARIARGAGLPAIVTTTFDTGIGTAMATHLAALLPSPRPACGLATLARLVHSLILSDESVDGPTMHPPAGAGLGVRLDDAALARYSGGISGSVAL